MLARIKMLSSTFCSVVVGTVLMGTMLICTMLVGTGCGSDSRSEAALTDVPLDDVVARFVFTDSSVPPDDHRSYTVEVQSGRATVEVRDYDRVLASSDVVLDERAVEALLQRLDGVPQELLMGECVGSPRYSSRVTDGSDVVPHLASADRCEPEAEALADVIVEAWEPVLSELGVSTLVSSTR
mgnify:CR=1 FL=1